MRFLLFSIAFIFCALTAGTIFAQSAIAQDCHRRDALGTSRVIEVDTERGLHIGLKTYPQTLYLRDKEVVLTFDDGPLPATTSRVLNALKAECVKATFFLIGRNARANPSLVRREIAEGHTVGHHSLTHPYRTLRGMSGTAAIADIAGGIAAVERAAYGTRYRGGKPRVPFFRFPGFADSAATKSWLDKRGVVVFGTDLWASDWTRMSPAAEHRLIIGRLAQKRRGMILFHDTNWVTVAMLPGFLRALKAGGYRVVHLVPRYGASPPLTHALPRWRSDTEAILARLMPRITRRGSGKKRK